MGKHGGDKCGTCGGKGQVPAYPNGKKGPQIQWETCKACGGSGEK